MLEIQKVLKQRHSSCLDKYKDASGAMRWKKAVGVSCTCQPFHTPGPAVEGCLRAW